MNDLQKALDAIDFQILKTANKEIFDSFTGGQRCPKLNPANDIDYFLQLAKSFFNYYQAVIAKLPEGSPDQLTEKLKCKLAQEQIESAIKILSFNKNFLDKNNFLFYNVAYVNDIIKRNSSTAD